MLRHTFAVLLLLACAGVSKADNILLQDGRALFNVVLFDTGTTQSRPLQVRYKPSSFLYDFHRRSVYALDGHGGYYLIADVAQTTDDSFGKFEAHRFMLDHNWHRYVPPAPFIIVPPTPTPTPKPTPPPKELLRPGELAETTLPMQQRIEKQLDLFINAQKSLADTIRFQRSVPGSDFKDEDARSARIELLQRQAKILTDYYPADENRVQKALEALRAEVDVVEKTGKFGHEY